MNVLIIDIPLGHRAIIGRRHQPVGGPGREQRVGCGVEIEERVGTDRPQPVGRREAFQDSAWPPGRAVRSVRVKEFGPVIRPNGASIRLRFTVSLGENMKPETKNPSKEVGPPKTAPPLVS